MSATPRQTYLDWLRIIAIAGILVFHAAMPYVSEWEWHLKNKETGHVLLEMNDFLHRFRMPLLFFISGMVSYYMLQHRTGGSFLGLRFRRLFIPLLVGILIIVPPQVYMQRLAEGYTGNFWDFYPTLFTTGVYPQGNISWHHLWFISYLLVYDILLAPLFIWLISAGGKRWLQRCNFLARGAFVYLLIIPSLLIYTFLFLHFSATNDLIHDYAYFPYWGLFVLVGFICVAHPLLAESLERNRRLSFTLAFTSLLFINYLRWNKLDHWQSIPGYLYDWKTYTSLAIGGICAWMWVFTAVGYGKKYLNRTSPVLPYLNEAIYPFYILHQTVIVILTYYLIGVPDGMGMKYLFTVVVTFLLTMCMYHLYIRPFAITRFLFGMKPRLSRRKASPKPATIVSTETAIPAR
ncbi:acyltransferase family protein [Chitinophaga nivalis]|uniref:Acyltransferase family protein n=1 Tax=Chitinophaga nivalis TaxID=2991709 RepID=A0ABT3IJB8_9BACT|nr:acyltransferase family protein [Chitinophaga nivalis]MCW3466251.1 acyltransferase family protein [Chitinophaga nivalis]MCW3484058.1 acyltransferase family protein [Chitinophaga nivalis]